MSKFSFITKSEKYLMMKGQEMNLIQSFEKKAKKLQKIYLNQGKKR